jgi:hypothetical protein
MNRDGLYARGPDGQKSGKKVNVFTKPCPEALDQIYSFQNPKAPSLHGSTSDGTSKFL